MIANNLTLSLPLEGSPKCDKNCPYCVSNMTYGVRPDKKLFLSNLSKAKTVARTSGVSSVLITAKGEPFLYQNMRTIGSQMREWPLEIQTNGKLLFSLFEDGDGDVDEFSGVVHEAFNVIAVSIDEWETWEKYQPMFEAFEILGKIVRVTLNVTDKLLKDKSFDPIGCGGGWIFNQALRMAKDTSVRQLSFRRIVVPQYHTFSDASIQTMEWIHDHSCEGIYNGLLDSLAAQEKKFVRSMDFGAEVYDIDGISVTHFDECVQSGSEDYEIRSLIYQEDGHLYTTWDSPGSILF